MNNEAESYLKSGSNEVRILEYKVSGISFGINILKVNKIVGNLHLQTNVPESHPSVRGVFEDRGKVIPIIDLAHFLGLPPVDKNQHNKVIITEFFEVSNGFMAERVDWIHHFKWEDVIDANGVMGQFDNRYVLGMVKPTEDHIISLLDYEAIILDLSPKLRLRQKAKTAHIEFDGGGRRILVAEDSASVRAMLVAELGEFGFEVDAVGDGKEALKRLKGGDSYFMVLSDVEMPQMDGLALLATIRDNNAGCDPNLPVIVYSSIGDMGMKKRAEFLRADAHITKLNVPDLLEKVRELADNEVVTVKKTGKRKTKKLEPVG